MIPQNPIKTDAAAHELALKIADQLIEREGANLGSTRDDLIAANFLPRDIDRHFPAARRIAAKRLSRDIADDISSNVSGNQAGQLPTSDQQPPSAP